MIDTLKHVTIWGAPDEYAALERIGSAWFAAYDGECMYMLESWAGDSYDPTAVVDEIAAIESLDVRTTTFFELCTSIAYREMAPDDVRCRRLLIEHDADVDEPFVVCGWAWDRCCRELEHLFTAFLVAREARGGALEVAPALEFGEVGYPNPEFPREGAEYQHALYAMGGAHICIWAGCADARLPTRSEAPIIINTILEQEGLDPAEIVFYDLEPDGSRCTRICAVLAGDELAYEMTEVTPDAAVVAQFKRELAAWMARSALPERSE